MTKGAIQTCIKVNKILQARVAQLVGTSSLALKGRWFDS